MAARALLVADVPLRRAQRLQWVRRASLALFFALTLLLPWLHVAANRAQMGVASVAWPRPPLLGAPWSISLFGIEVLDPLAVLGVLFAQRGGTAGHVWIPAALLGALPAVVLVTALGRYFCAWVCPYAVLVGLSHALRAALTRLGVPLLDVKIPPRTARWVLVGALLATALSATQFAALLYPPSLIGREAFRWAATGSMGAGAALLAGLFVFDTTISRAGFCRSLCPGGALFSLMARSSPVTVEREATACTSCGVCDAVCNMGQSPMTDAVDAGCDRCARCVSSCPTDALDLVAIARRDRSRP